MSSNVVIIYCYQWILTDPFTALLLALAIQMSAQAGLRELRESCPPNDLDGPQYCR